MRYTVEELFSFLEFDEHDVSDMNVLTRALEGKTDWSSLVVMGIRRTAKARLETPRWLLYGDA